MTDGYNTALKPEDIAVLKDVLQSIFEDEVITDAIVDSAWFNCPISVRRKAYLYGWGDAETKALFETWASKTPWLALTIKGFTNHV